MRTQHALFRGNCGAAVAPFRLVEWAVRVNQGEYMGDKVTTDKHRKAWEAARDRLANLNRDKQINVWKNVKGPA